MNWWSGMLARAGPMTPRRRSAPDSRSIRNRRPRLLDLYNDRGIVISVDGFGDVDEITDES